LLSHKNKEIRQEAAGTLANIKHSIKITPIMPDLIILLSDESKEVQLVAARTIVEKSNKIVDFTLTFPIILKMLRSSKDDERNYSASILSNMIYRTTYLIKALKEKGYKKDTWRLFIPIIPNLKNFLFDKNVKVKEKIASSLARIYLGNNQPEELIHLLEQIDKKTKKTVLKTLEYEKYGNNSVLISYISKNDAKLLTKKIKNAAEKKLKSLDLSSSAIGKRKWLILPPEIGLLTSVTRLNLSNNDFKFLPKEIGKLKNLEELILSQNKLKSLPPEIGNLKNLLTLFLYKNNISTLPPEFGNLSKLRYLQLIQNKLSSLPEEFGNLTSLQICDLHENNLTSLPKTLGNLVNLTNLDIRYNQITDLPEEFEKLQKLKQLNLDYNKSMNKIPKVK